MANRSYLPTSHRLLSGFSPLTSPRGSSLSNSAANNSRSNNNTNNSPPPEFSYDAVYSRDHQTSRTGSVSSRESSGLPNYNANRTPSSPGSSALTMAYSSVQDFPYGLSGVQMPTYNFGSELYNYVSNGFPRKSRMCTFCNKVFTRSTTRRYHERRCPLLRASNSLAKNEENNQASTLSALKEQHSQQQQQRQKESPGGNGSGSSRSSNAHHNSSLPRTLSSSITNTTAAQSAGSIPQASPPLPSLHPAYPTSFPKSAAALVSSPSRSSAYSYPHPYSSHFYNSLSAAALVSSIEKSNNSSSKLSSHLHQHQQQQQHQHESDSSSISWKASSVSPPTPNSKLQEQVNSFNSKLSSTLSGNGPLSFSKAFSPEAVVDLTARYCENFSLRARPPVFPAPSLRGPPHSPPTPEPGETQNKFQGQGHHRYEDELMRAAAGSGRDGGDREDRRTSRDSPEEGMASLSSSHHGNNKLHWPMSGGGAGGDKEKVTSSSYNSMISSSSSLGVDGYRRQNSSPLSDTTWQGDKDNLETRATFMKVEPLDEDDEDDFDDEEDEEEVEEDEEQFKTESELGHSETGVEDNDGSGVVVEGERRMSSSSSTTTTNKNASYSHLVCQFCEKMFTDPVARKAHEALHSQKKLYSCCLCPASFHCGYSLRVHTMRNHKEGPYKCKYCFLDYGPASEFRTHLIKEHSLPKTEYQSLKFFSVVTNSDSNSPVPDSLLSTYAVSEGEHDDDSATRAGGGSAFKHHHRRSADHPEEHYNFADETTKALLSPNSISSSSSSAVVAATNVKEGWEMCKVCNKSYDKKYAHVHDNNQDETKPYACPICNKRFGYKNNMKSHMKLHQGLKPYQCQICGARFTRGSTLRRHGRRHNLSDGRMMEYVMYDRASGGRGGGAAVAAAAAAAAASLAQHKASMVPNSLLGPKSHYLLPTTSQINTSSSNAITSNNNNINVPTSQLSSTHHHHHQHQSLHPKPLQSSDSLAHSHSHHPHHHSLHSAISSKHSAFGPMPSLIPATSAALGNGLVDSERFGIGNSNNSNNNKQKSPNHLLSPTGTSPRAASGHHLPFPSPNSITNPMVGGLAAVAAANLFGYPNAATAPQLYQFYASAAAAANPLMGYAPYSANQNMHSVQSDALNLSLNKRKSPCKNDDVADNDDSDVEEDATKSRRTGPKLPRLDDDADRKMTSPNDEHNFADSSSGVSSVSSDSKSMIKQENDIKQENERRSSTSYSNEIKCEDIENDADTNLDDFKKASSPSSSPHKNPAQRANSSSNTKCDSENDEECDELSNSKPHRYHHHRHQHENRRRSDESTHRRESRDEDDNNSDGHLSVKVSTEDFAAQVNICCPSPQVQSSTGSVSAVSDHHSPMSHNSNSPVGSSSGPDSLILHNNQSANSPTGSGVTSPVDSNSAPSPTPINGSDSDQDILLSLLSSGRLFRCSFCDIYFAEYAMFRLHQKYHESDLDRPFLCAVCHEDCKDKTYFSVHLSEHLGLGPKNGLP